MTFWYLMMPHDRQLDGSGEMCDFSLSPSVFFFLSNAQLFNRNDDIPLYMLQLVQTDLYTAINPCRLHSHKYIEFRWEMFARPISRPADTRDPLDRLHSPCLFSSSHPTGGSIEFRLSATTTTRSGSPKPSTYFPIRYRPRVTYIVKEVLTCKQMSVVYLESAPGIQTVFFLSFFFLPPHFFSSCLSPLISLFLLILSFSLTDSGF